MARQARAMAQRKNTMTEKTSASPKSRGGKSATPKAPKTVMAAAAEPEVKFKPQPEPERVETPASEAPFGPTAFLKLGEDLRERVVAGATTMRDAFKNFGGQFGFMRESAGETAEAVRESISLAGQGVREVNLQLVEFAQKDLNRFFDLQKSLLQAKSIKEVLEIQSDYLKTQIDYQVKQMRAINEMAVEAAKEAAEPLTAQVKKMSPAA